MRTATVSKSLTRSVRPGDLPAGSERRVWWRCHAGPDHEWRTKVSERTFGGHSCPFCANHRVSVTNSVATLHPDLVAQWHLEKNGDRMPEDVVAGSNQYAWWICEEGPDHVWRTRIMHRTLNRSGCPFCAGKKVSVTNSLAARFPRLAAEWHATKNGDLTPHDVTYGSGKRVWWQCAAGPDHEWQTMITNRTRQPQGLCPFCVGRRASVTNSLQTHFPKVAREWDPDRNDELAPADVVAVSRKSYWWRCALGHVWRAPVLTRTVKRRGCPVCSLGALQ